MAYLEENYVPALKRLPGLERLVTARPAAPDTAGYDVILELWFTDANGEATGFNTPEGERVIEDAADFLYIEDAVRLTVTDETLRHQSVPEGVI